MGNMSDDLREQLEKLERTVAAFEAASKRSLGFVKTVEYRGISFNVSKRFVLPELSPLAFFQLVEHNTDGIEEAIVRLYDRVSPLLTCAHDWTNLKRESDEHLRRLGGSLLQGESLVHVCKRCTAYALNAPLPVVGRSLEWA
jgi:hypothetical protein